MAAPMSQQVFDYLDRALSDDDLIAQLREFVTDSRRATRRAGRKGAGDRRAQASAFAALSALSGFLREARQPPPPRRGGRRTLLLAGTAAGAALVARRKRARPVD